MQHLLDFFDRYVRGSDVAALYDDGFRTWSYTGYQVRAPRSCSPPEQRATTKRIELALVELLPEPSTCERSDAA